MRARHHLAVIALTFGMALPAGAPPPLPPFPSAVLPSGPAPLNTRLWLVGTDAPAPAQVGLSLTINGSAATAPPLEREGCCVLSAVSTLVAGDDVDVFVTSAAGDASATFVVGANADLTPPLLQTAILLDEANVWTIGVNASDDVGLAGAWARSAESVAFATVDNVVQIRTPSAGCVDVSAVDIAGNESAAQTLCGTPPADAGVPDDDGDDKLDDDPPASGCNSATMPAPAVAWLVTLAFFTLRRRAQAMRSARRGSRGMTHRRRGLAPSATTGEAS